MNSPFEALCSAKPAFALFAAAVVGSASAALPVFPENSISPLYGKWVDAQFIHQPGAHWIGQKYITDIGRCRYRYRMTGSEIWTDKSGGKPARLVDLMLYDGKPASAKADWTCGGPVYVEFVFSDIGEAAGTVSGFYWTECDSEAAFKKFKRALKDHQLAAQGDCVDFFVNRAAD